MENSRNTVEERSPNIQENGNEAENRGQRSISVFHPDHTCYRFIALVFMCLIGIGSYFCYDNPGALQDKFKEDLKLSTTQFVFLYSIYSWPNIILCFIGGFLIDRVFGIRLGTLLYMSILLTGALLFALGGYTNSFWLMILGRFVFGVGGESLAVAQNNYAVRWFKGKELNMVFGLQLSFARVGSTINFMVMEPLYEWVSTWVNGYQRTGVVLFFAAMTCVFSLICGLILAWMDKRADEKLSANNSSNKDEPVKLSDIRYFSSSFWMVTIICVSYYVAIFPFVALGKIFFERKFDYDPQSANMINSIIYILSAVASPVLGLVIDKTGRNLYWVVTSILTTITAHGILAFTFWNPFIGMVTLGLSYSLLASALWPLVSLIVPENQLGTAYGICQSVQNMGLAVVSLITGVIVDKGGYFMLEIFFLGCLFVALIAAVSIIILNTARNGILNLTPKERQAHLKGQDDRTNLLDSDSTEEDTTDRNDQQEAANSDRIRSRYLNKIGTHPDIEGMTH